MSLVDNYRRMMAQLTVGLDYLSRGLGQRLVGTFALVFDNIAEGSRQAFLQHLPGSPDQAEDSLNQSGSDAGMFRYRGESLDSWRSRVGDPWERHEQGGTDVALLREIDIWGAIVFPSTWVAGQCYLIESQFGKFALIVPASLIPWGAPRKYGDGCTYGGQDIMYGLTGSAEDVNTLRRIVRAIKPSRSKARAVIIVSGHVYGQRNLKYGDGSKYGAVTFRLQF